MILPDVNVLVYAFRPDSSEHAFYAEWLWSVLEGEEAYGLSTQVLASVARIVTSPRIFLQPDPIETVLAFSDQLLSQPHCQLIQPGQRHWAIFCHLCSESGVKVKLVPDAWFAALAI